MAASNSNPRSNPLPPEQIVCLSAPALRARMEEEINRAGRHGIPLSFLLVVIDNLEELSRDHGSELPEQTLAYIAKALPRQLRRFDRIGMPSEGELLVVLPGADSPRSEIVARRVLERIRTIKVEAEGTRQPLRISVGLATWQEDLGSEDMLARSRAAAQRGNGEDAPEGTALGEPLQIGSPPALGRPGPS
jgi:diguanylate cyclase (GGDEF)-like protein